MKEKNAKRNLKLYSPKHKTRMNKKQRREFILMNYGNNRQSFAEKTNRIIMKTTCKRDTQKMCQKQMSSFMKNAAATSVSPKSLTGRKLLQTNYLKETVLSSLKSTWLLWLGFKHPVYTSFSSIRISLSTGRSRKVAPVVTLTDRTYPSSSG